MYKYLLQRRKRVLFSCAFKLVFGGSKINEED